MYYNSLPRRAKREEVYPRCPVCGEECETVYLDHCGSYAGCNVCMDPRDAWDVPECFPGLDREEE